MFRKALVANDGSNGGQAAAKVQAQAPGAAFEPQIVVGRSAPYNRLIGGTTNRRVELAPCKAPVVK